MEHFKNTIRKKQRLLIIMLLDFKSVLRKIHHNLVSEANNYHKIQNSFPDIIDSLYKEFCVCGQFQQNFVPNPSK